MTIDLSAAGALALAVSALAGYGSAYLRKRGENLATKQDVAEITRRVEAVKSDFHVLSESQLTSMTRRHDSLVAFYDVATDLVVERLPRSYADFKADGGAGLGEHLDAVTTLFAQLRVTYHRLALYFPREAEVVQTASDLVRAAVRLQRDYGSKFAAAHVALSGAVNRMEPDSSEGWSTEVVRQKAEEYVAAVALPLIRVEEAYDVHLKAVNTFFLTEGPHAPQPDN